MLETLPLEVLEYMCSFLTVHDLVNMWNAVDMEASESFWKQMCQRQEYKKAKDENCSWKNVFVRHMNWICGTYVKRKYSVELNSVDFAQASRSQSTESLSGQILLIDSREKSTVALDISHTPTLVHSFPGKLVSQQGNKFLTYNSSELVLYSCEINIFNKAYSTLLEFPIQIILKICSLTNDFLVWFDQRASSIKVVDLMYFKEFSLALRVTALNFFSLRVSKEVLFILILNGSMFKLKRLNLENKIWLQDIVLFQNAALIGEPLVEINSSLIVSWSNWLEGRGITPVKVFSVDGTFLSTLPFKSCSNLFETIEPEKMLWMILKGDYLIFSTSNTTVSVWANMNANSIKVIPKEEEYYIGQKVISSSLLALSYKHCFKIVDYINATYLYTVFYELENSIDIFQRSKTYANEYFYIYFQCKEADVISNPNVDKDIPLASNCCSEFKTLETKKTKYFMHIYDFK